MTPANLTRLSGVAGVLAGTLLAVANLLALLTSNPTSTPAQIVTTGYYKAQGLLSLLAVVMLLGALVGLYVRQSEAAGVLGLVAFLVAFVGTALVVGVYWTNAFITPVVARETPEAVGGSGSGWTFSVWNYYLGWVLFALSALRTKVFPRAAATLLLVGAVLVAFPTPRAFATAFEVAVGVAFALGVGWVSFSLLRPSGGPAEGSSRVR